MRFTMSLLSHMHRLGAWRAAAGSCAAALALTAAAQQDLETSVPSNWTSSAGSSLSITTNHYKLGSQALQWDWTSNAVLTITDPGIAPADVTDSAKATCDFWVHCPVALPGQRLRVQFYDAVNALQYSFDVDLGFTGWRRAVRNFRYDMIKVGGGSNFKQVRLLAPVAGVGQFFFDAVTWAGPRFTRFKDAANKGITGSYSNSDYYNAGYVYLPDIPAATPTPAELADLSLLRTNWLAVNAASAPSSSALRSAYTSWTNMHIISNSFGIKGAVVSHLYTDPLESWVDTLGESVYWSNNADSAAKMKLLLRHLWDQGMDAGSGEAQAGGAEGYDFRQAPRGFILAARAYDADFKDRAWQMLHWMYRMGRYWRPNPPPGDNVDDIYLTQRQQLGAILFLAPDDAVSVQYLRGFKRYLERFLTHSNGTDDAIKVDGVSFHHRTHYIAYMYSLSELADVLHMLRGTSFQANSNAYITLRGAYQAMLIMSNKSDSSSKPGQYANSLSGRHPFGVSLPFSYSQMQKLGQLGGEVLGMSADPVVARSYNRLFGGSYPYSLFTPYGVEPNPTGFYQFNYSPVGIYRQSNWVATIKGMGTNFWGSEIYPLENLYGRYTSYGAAEIWYPGAKEISGFSLTGWDWNKPPGTTTIQLPWEMLISEGRREDVRSALNFSGALSFKGDSGLYACNFREVQKTGYTNHNGTFAWKKSWFCFSNQIVCLGSGITNNDSAHPTITTLFQAVLTNTTRPTIINGASVTTFPHSTTLPGTVNRWVLDHTGTGYYVRPGSSLRIARASQSSPDETGSGSFSTANFASAWIDHGTAPGGVDYEYVVVPAITTTDMWQLATRYANPATTPYEVLQKDDSAHVLRWKNPERIGYALFSANELAGQATNAGVILSASTPCLVMTEFSGGNLSLSLADPTLNLINNTSTVRNVTLTLLGQWRLAAPSTNAVIAGLLADKTLLRVSTLHGLASTVELQINLPPAITPVNNRTIPINSSTGPLPFSVSDDFTAPSNIIVVIDSSTNLALAPLTGIVLEGSGANRTVTVTPSPGQIGSSQINLRATDGMAAASTGFVVTVFEPSSATLSASSTAAGLQFAWPASIGDWELLWTDSLAPPARWETNPSPPALDAGQWKVAVSPTNSLQFFRLRAR